MVMNGVSMKQVQTTADIYTHLDYRDKMNTANAAADMVLNIMHKNA